MMVLVKDGGDWGTSFNQWNLVGGLFSSVLVQLILLFDSVCILLETAENVLVPCLLECLSTSDICILNVHSLLVSWVLGEN